MITFGNKNMYDGKNNAGISMLDLLIIVMTVSDIACWLTDAEIKLVAVKG